MASMSEAMSEGLKGKKHFYSPSKSKMKKMAKKVPTHKELLKQNPRLKRDSKGNYSY